MIAAAIAIALLAALAILDTEISHVGRGLPRPIVDAIGWLTLLGDSGYILVASLVVAIGAGLGLLVARRQAVVGGLKQLAALSVFVFLGVGLPGLVTAIVKRIIGRGRPVIEAGAPDFQLLAWLDWTYQSFPSGHATTGFALCFTVSFLAPRAFAWMLMLALLISMSRIVVGAHYATDIVGGAIIGTLGAYLVRNVFASRGWLFEARSDGAIALKPLDAIRGLMRPRS